MFLSMVQSKEPKAAHSLKIARNFDIDILWEPYNTLNDRIYDAIVYVKLHPYSMHYFQTSKRAELLSPKEQRQTRK